MSETWAEVAASAPSTLRPHLLDAVWDAHELWALDLPVEQMPLHEIAWHLDLPLWRHDGRVWSVSPREVAADPARYRDQFLRTLRADLGFALDVTWWRERWTIVDGVHRLLQATLLGREKAAVRKVPPDMFTHIGPPR